MVNTGRFTRGLEEAGFLFSHKAVTWLCSRCMFHCRKIVWYSFFFITCVKRWKIFWLLWCFESFLKSRPNSQSEVWHESSTLLICTSCIQNVTLLCLVKVIGWSSSCVVSCQGILNPLPLPHSAPALCAEVLMKKNVCKWSFFLMPWYYTCFPFSCLFMSVYSCSQSKWIH